MLEMCRITAHSYRNRRYLHPDDGVDEEEHHDEQGYMRESLQTQHQQSLSGGNIPKEGVRMEVRAADLERLDEGPQQVTDPL